MASNLLWAHLLRKDAASTDSPSQIPPIALQDKTGTSMRMLIHDTQVNLERFSTRLDGLLQRVDDCRTQVVNANKLLDVERDKVLTEMLEIANRCQTEMKAHVGTPAQAPVLDLVRVSQAATENAIQALDKRIDALQTLLQTHAHTMQSIQDQQNLLMGAVLPLVPLIHGVPSQVDQIKTALLDMVTNAVSTMTKSVEGVQSTLVAELRHDHQSAGSSARMGPLCKSVSGSWRKRPNTSMQDAQEINVLTSSPLDKYIRHGECHFSTKRTRIEGATHHTGNGLSQTPRTPRRPLVDLPLPLDNNARVQCDTTANHPNSRLREYMRPSTARPLQLREHARPALQESPIAQRYDMRLAVDKFDVGLPGAPQQPSRQDTLSKTIKVEGTREVNPVDVVSVHSSPLSSPRSPLLLATSQDPNETCVTASAPPIRQPLRPQDDVSDASLVGVPPSLSDPLPDASPPKAMSLRDRRAQISRFGRTQTRRFISLVPWSDGEE